MASNQRMAAVTGAGSGLGQAIAIRLAADGFAVAAIDLDEAAARATARQIGAKAGAYRADVSRSAE
ncbi:MAG: SDR family NAD(P)-dependent oxidoreductase, partial [Betaproteobacteria bacterium]|nr:SDR family NAD(P)-dependent oxidoreductase [Betaproteobacteria bacterium]